MIEVLVQLIPSVTHVLTEKQGQILEALDPYGMQPKGGGRVCDFFYGTPLLHTICTSPFNRKILHTLLNYCTPSN